MLASLPKKLPDFSQGSILVVGDIMLDRYWFGDTGRISPEAPVPVVRVNQVDNRAGGAGNVALNMTSLGSQVTLLGIIGKDEAADSLKAQLSAANVKHDFCTDDHISTIIKLRVLSRHQQLIRLDFEQDELTALDKSDIEARFSAHLAHCKLVILSDYKKGTLSNPQAFIQLARKANVPVLVDPKGNDFRVYQHADILTPNFKEFEAIVGACHSEQALLEKGRKLLDELQIKSLLITRGADGMTLIEKDNTTHLPAFAREVFDVTGAGDTVIGTLGAAIAAGSDIMTAMALANQAASIVVNKLGAATVSAPELEAAMTDNLSFSAGILNEEQALLAISQANIQGKKVVFTNGCFDILHAGHVTYLQHAKQLGDYLVVAVNTDESIRKLKGPNRPINHLTHRMTVLAGLGVVDWVIPFADDTPERLLRMLRPNVLVKGADYRADQIVGADIVKAYGGEVRSISHDISTSSSSIFEQLQKIAGESI